MVIRCLNNFHIIFIHFDFKILHDNISLTIFHGLGSEGEKDQITSDSKTFRKHKFKLKKNCLSAILARSLQNIGIYFESLREFRISQTQLTAESLFDSASLGSYVS